MSNQRGGMHFPRAHYPGKRERHDNPRLDVVVHAGNETYLRAEPLGNGRPDYYLNARGETVMSLGVFGAAKFDAVCAALGVRGA